MLAESLTCPHAAAPASARERARALLNIAWDGYVRWRARRRDRAVFLGLLQLDDHLLDDLGCTREEVRWAAALPLSESAAQALRRRARARRRSGTPR